MDTNLSTQTIDEKSILLKTGFLCLKLTKNYFNEVSSIAKKLIRDNIDVRSNKFKLKELDNYLELGSFFIEETKKYYKVYQFTDESDSKIHCFVDKESGLVYKPLNRNSPNKRRVYEIDKCILHADWRGYYLNDVTPQ
jgi:hypothetical protein